MLWLPVREESVRFRPRCFVRCVKCDQEITANDSGQVARIAQREGWKMDQEGSTLCGECVEQAEEASRE